MENLERPKEGAIHLAVVSSGQSIILEEEGCFMNSILIHDSSHKDRARVADDQEEEEQFYVPGYV